jgi:PKD repeat protein
MEDAATLCSPDEMQQIVYNATSDCGGKTPKTGANESNWTNDLVTEYEKHIESNDLYSDSHGRATKYLSLVIGNPAFTTPYSFIDIYGDPAFTITGNLGYTISTGGTDAPSASFNISPPSGTTETNFTFTDTSINKPTSWNWNFGDNTTNSTQQNTTHTYSAAGNYTVNLTVSNANGSSSKNMTINVTSKPALPVFPNYTKPPTDPNHDGFYEDINGNGQLDFDDVVAYYDNMDWIGQNKLTAYFDYNRNGQIDFDDVVKLYDML